MAATERRTSAPSRRGTRSGTGGSRSRPDAPSEREIDRAVWERAMKQLSVCTRLLATVLLALAARIIISGPTPITVLSATILAVLLLAASLLTRHGRRHQPRSASSRPRGGRSARA